MIYLVIAFSTLLLSIFLTPYFISYLNSIRVVDAPDHKRKIHSEPVPRLGGLIIYSVSMLALFTFYGDLNSIKIFIAASVIIIVLGITDDFFGVKWNVKFLFQTASAILLLVFLYPHFNSVTILGYTIPQIPALIILFLFIVGTTNSFNLLDGMDGLVSGLSLMIFFVTFLIGYKTSNLFLLILSASVFGTTLGFLRFNAFPASIFLGDSGSLTLGLFVTTAALTSAISMENKSLDLSLPIMLLALPILDTLKVMFLRIFNGKNPFLPDKTHLHHLIFGKQIKHKTTVFILEIFTLLFVVSGIYYFFYNKIIGISIFVLLSCLLLLVNHIIDLLIKTNVSSKVGKFRQIFPQKLIFIYKKIFLPLVALTIIGMVLYLVPFHSGLRNNFVYLTMVFLILFLLYGYVNYKKNKNFIDILVFFNIVILFSLIGKSDFAIEVINFSFFARLNIHRLIILLLLPTISFFLVFRERILERNDSLLSGIDLIVLVVISLAFVSSQLIPLDKTGLISDSIFCSFLIYLFYKITILIKPAFHPALFFGSYLIALIPQTIIFATH